MKLELKLASELGPHLADGSRAVAFRMVRIEPYLNMDTEIVVDFTGVRHANSSFVNGLLTGLFEEKGRALLDRMTFRGCSPLVKVLVETAVSLGLMKNKSYA